jgi:prepilin-type N-terminal cleavage/methylation domain-containing protein
MQIHSTHKNTSGFTLIELLIVIAIIGILAGIAIPQFNQYKMRGYDTSAKQSLRDVALLCNAYWIDNDCSEECSLPKIKDAAYGFNQNSDLAVTLPSASSQCSNFCASAKSNSSPNTYSIDSAALISSGGTCGGAGGSVQTASAGGSVPISYDPATQPEERPCTVIPDKIYNEDGSPHVYPGFSSSKQSHPLSGYCVRYDKETDNYYAMTPESIVAGNFELGTSWGRTATPGGDHSRQQKVLELFVARSGIEITEGPTEQSDRWGTSRWQGGAEGDRGTNWGTWAQANLKANTVSECDGGPTDPRVSVRMKDC